MTSVDNDHFLYAACVHFPCLTIKYSLLWIIYRIQLIKKATSENVHFNYLFIYLNTVGFPLVVRFNYMGFTALVLVHSLFHVCPLGPIIHQIIELGFLSPLCLVQAKGLIWALWLCLILESLSIKGVLTKIKLYDEHSQVCQTLFAWKWTVKMEKIFLCDYI